jgi:uncharacterized protein (DUF1499 family)
MARRPVHSYEPVSKLATWAGHCGLFSLAVAALSVIIVRSGLLEVGPALVTFGGALVLAVLAILLAFASFVTIWRQGLSGLGYSLTGMLLGILLLAYPGYLGYRSLKLPSISDVTTDPANPPRFDTLARLRPRGRIDYPPGNADKQRAAYSDIQPMQVPVPPKAAYDAALSLITKRKWLIVDERPPAPSRPGSIEAVARTPIMGFREDVVVRIAPLGQGARIDLRSASRYDMHDFGGNASRLRSLLEDLDEAVGEPPDQRAEEPKKPQAPAKRPPTNRRN